MTRYSLEKPSNTPHREQLFEFPNRMYMSLLRRKSVCESKHSLHQDRGHHPRSHQTQHEVRARCISLVQGGGERAGRQEARKAPHRIVPPFVGRNFWAFYPQRQAGHCHHLFYVCLASAGVEIGKGGVEVVGISGGSAVGGTCCGKKGRCQYDIYVLW